MKEYNWITVKEKSMNAFINVRQKEPFSNFFIDANGNEFDVSEIDFTEKYFIFKHDDKEIESGLDGYRAIYG